MPIGITLPSHPVSDVVGAVAPVVNTAVTDFKNDTSRPPSPSDIQAQGQELAGQAVNAFAAITDTVMKVGVTFDAPKVDQIKRLLDIFQQNTSNILSDISQDTQDRMNSVAIQAVDPNQLLTLLSNAVVNAQNALAKKKDGDLVVTGGKVVTEFYVKLPGPAAGSGAYTRVEMDFKSRKYSTLKGGTG